MRWLRSGARSEPPLELRAALVAEFADAVAWPSPDLQAHGSSPPVQAPLPASLRDRLEREFSEAELAELALVAGVLTGMARILFALSMSDAEPVHELERTLEEEL